MAKFSLLLAILLVGVGVVLGVDVEEASGKSADAHVAGGPLVNVDSQKVKQVVVLSRQNSKDAGAAAASDA